MVKITFQSVAGPKVEKDNDKSEILIPHAAVSGLLGPFQGAPARPARARPAGPLRLPTGDPRGGVSGHDPSPLGRKQNTHNVAPPRARCTECECAHARSSGRLRPPGRCRWSGDRGLVRPKSRINS